MKKYENDFVYGRERLRILLVATAVGCAASLLTPQYSLVQVALMCLTVVLFVTCLALIFKYCRCPNCGKVSTVDEETLLDQTQELVCPYCNASFDIELEGTEDEQPEDNDQ